MIVLESLTPLQSLNRTSVGLKRLFRSPRRAERRSLNRTSVGLKQELERGDGGQDDRLNRTSVGLKLT